MRDGDALIIPRVAILVPGAAGRRGITLAYPGGIFPRAISPPKWAAPAIIHSCARQPSFPLLALTACFAVIALYYTTHKPFTPELALALVLIAWRLLVAGGMAALAGGLGLRLWPGEGQPPLLRLALQAGLGLGAFSLGILIVGSTLGIPAWAWWLLPVVLGVLLRRAVWAWLRQWAGLLDLWRESGSFARWLAGMMALLFLLTLCTSLAPPLHFDSLVYHLVMPHAYLDAGRISYLPWIVMTGMPQTTEMLHTWAMALGGNEAAVTLVWVIGLLACLGLLGYLQQRWDARAAWVGAAALLAGLYAGQTALRRVRGLAGVPVRAGGAGHPGSLAPGRPPARPDPGGHLHRVGRRQQIHLRRAGTGRVDRAGLACLAAPRSLLSRPRCATAWQPRSRRCPGLSKTC